MLKSFDFGIPLYINSLLANYRIIISLTLPIINLLTEETADRIDYCIAKIF